MESLLYEEGLLPERSEEMKKCMIIVVLLMMCVVQGCASLSTAIAAYGIYQLIEENK
jgi:hypothetical protein